MKRSTRMISMFMAVILASLFMAIPVLALPPIPSSFYGMVKVNSSNVADGTVVQALINGQVVSESTTITYQGSSFYSLDIPGDDTDTPAIEGGHEGDTIQFKIGGSLAVQTAIWHSGTNISLNLTRTSASKPTPTPTKQHPLLRSQVLIPASMTTQFGTTSGSLSSLSLSDQTGTESNSAAYVAFQTPNGTYAGYQSFILPVDIRATMVSTILLQINFMGPASSTQIWTWSVYNWNSKQWIKLGDTIGAKDAQWQTLLFRMRNPHQYISAGGEIRIQLRSNNANGDAKVDYEALHVTYLSVPPTPTSAVPIVTPRRPGVSSGPLSTPTP